MFVHDLRVHLIHIHRITLFQVSDMVFFCFIFVPTNLVNAELNDLPTNPLHWLLIKFDNIWFCNFHLIPDTILSVELVVFSVIA